MRFQGNLPLQIWGDCALATYHLINQTPSVVLNYKTPFECVYQETPPLNHIRVFGCLDNAHNIKHGGDKFASRKCVFLGYPYTQKGLKLYDMEMHEFFVSQDVKIFEHLFSFQYVIGVRCSRDG